MHSAARSAWAVQGSAHAPARQFKVGRLEAARIRVARPSCTKCVVAQIGLASSLQFSASSLQSSAGRRPHLRGLGWARVRACQFGASAMIWPHAPGAARPPINHLAQSTDTARRASQLAKCTHTAPQPHELATAAHSAADATAQRAAGQPKGSPKAAKAIIYQDTESRSLAADCLCGGASWLILGRR